MASVEVSINGRFYRIACEDGQESRLIKLAAMVDEKVAGLVEQVGQVGDSRLLVMASLLIADEIEDLRLETTGGTAGGNGALPEAEVAAAIAGMADRIERIAATLERP